MPDQTDKILKLRFHGRILDHLGIQMYQSPVAAISELVANAWDANAECVDIRLPENLGEDAEIVIRDDGYGMTFEECQNRYLNVGLNRRSDDPNSVTPDKNRPVLGRKGIGKFAGFGIAQQIQIETTSRENGERTVFTLDLQQLRGEEYVGTESHKVEVAQYEPPDDDRIGSHGTVVRLIGLTLRRTPTPARFLDSMARRFLLQSRADDFEVSINGDRLPDSSDLQNVEYVFPRDYSEEDSPPDIQTEGEWGTETLSNGRSIRWRFVFYRTTIDVEELRGISVFARGKLAQSPFFFNLTGGLGGQHGQEYLSGQIEADYLDETEHDVIAPERQRVNWEDAEAIPLLEWGQERVKSLLRNWKELRARRRQEAIENRVAGFSDRLERLGQTESRSIRTALRKLGTISTLTDDQFSDIGRSIVGAAEKGRLTELIARMGNADELDEASLLRILLEEEVLTALNIAEAVKTKINAVAGLKARIDAGQLENAVRDYIAENPWLLDPTYQTYRIETTLRRFLNEMMEEADIPDDFRNRRVDLVLSSGEQLIVIEFMRPGIPLDLDHINRYDTYFRTIQTNFEANSNSPFRRVRGIIVADDIARKNVIRNRLKSMEKDDMFAMDWGTLFRNSLASWEDFLIALANRTPRDPRMESLIAEMDLPGLDATSEANESADEGNNDEQANSN